MKDWNHIARLSPSGCKVQNEIGMEEEEKEIDNKGNDENISVKKSKSTWARLIAKIYEVDPLVFPKL